MEFWNLIKNNEGNIGLLRDPIFIIFTLLNFLLNIINLYRSRSKKAILKLNHFSGELFRFKRGSVLRAHLKMDFDLNAVNENIYLKQFSISNPKSANINRQVFIGLGQGNFLHIKNIRFYLRNWPSLVDSQEGWEYDIMPTTELPINKILIDHQIQYRSMGVNTEKHNNFRDEWGRINPQDWSYVDGSLLIEKNSKKHVTILCELTFENTQDVELNKLFSIDSATCIDMEIEFNSRTLKERVMLKSANLG